MHSSLQRETPEFLLNSIVYCDNLKYKKNERSCFVLTKNLKFYEFRQKQLLHCIDLRETCFADLKQRIKLYDGKKCKSLGDFGDNEVTTLQTEASEKSYEIKFEKYIYKNFDFNKLYIILSCWDKLVILQRLNDTTTTNGLRVIAEYENVENIKVIPSTTMKYQAMVKIQFCNGNILCTNFEENGDNKNLSNAANILEQKREFKQLLERVRQTKAELQFHKEITHKQFQSFKNKQTFGNNFLRSTRLDEKAMLARCGDVWIRITSGNELLIGLPLANNCAPPNLTILKNLCPVLNTIVTTEPNSSHALNYEYRVFQLHQTFENLETLETFFQSEDIEFDQNTWSATNDQILPMSFVVLVVKFRLSQLMLVDGKCQLFVCFQIQKDLQMDESDQTHTFEQHLFIKSLDFQEILHRRKEYEISFNEKTLHQDFLALAMANFNTQLQISFASSADESKFEELLSHKFDFEIVHRKNRDAREYNDDACMEIDEVSKDCKRLPWNLFYNRKPSSLWFGALIKRAFENRSSNDCETIQTTYTFYNKSQENTFLMLKLIFNELIALKCNVINIKQGDDCQLSDTKVAHFENAMRQEVANFLALMKNEYEDDILVEKMKCLMQLQYNTDILAAAHCHDIK